MIFVVGNDRRGSLILKKPLLGVPFDRNTSLSLQTLGGEADALPPCTDAFHDCWSEQRERHQMAHIAVADTFSGCDLPGRDRSSRRQFAEPLVPACQCSKQRGICPRSYNCFAWEHQTRFGVTTPHLQRNKTGHSEV